MQQTSAKWHSLASAVDSFLSKNQILAYHFELVCDNWNVILEYPICEKIVPYCWRSNTLVLAVEDESYTMYVKMREATIASQVRAVIGNDYCRNVAVKKVDFANFEGMQKKELKG